MILALDAIQATYHEGRRGRNLQEARKGHAESYARNIKKGDQRNDDSKPVFCEVYRNAKEMGDFVVFLLEEFLGPLFNYASLERFC